MSIHRGLRAPQPSHPGCSRRRFVQGLALGAAALPWPLREARAAAGPAVLSGTAFDLTIGAARVNFTGRSRAATVVNGLLPGPLLTWREGDTVRLRVTNQLSEPTSIHWHGVIVPAAMDGVPGLSFAGIEPGGSYEYRFEVRQSGTYWYHSHSGFQEQTGLYAPLVVLPRGPDPLGADRDHVVMLSDWTDADPRRVLARLKAQPDYYNYRQRTVGDFLRDADRDGLRAAWADRASWGDMRMNPTDLADVTAATYTYLINGRTPAGNWTGLARRGERVRLRFINGSAMTYFDVRIPGLPMTVVAADGQPVREVTVEEFRIAPAETYDVIVTPPDDAAYTVFAQSMDRGGFARGTLAPAPGMSAPVPALDRPALLGMADMGHDAHAGHARHQGHAMADSAIAHAPTEFGATVDMRATSVSPRLDDPGVGLRDNGRRVLTYADLVSAFPDPDGREPGRTLELHLTGNMGRYLWSFNGVPFADAEPLRFTYGERLRLRLVNDGMMEHPIHLHGMWSDLEDETGAFKVRKHTISVKPGHVASYRVSADALGRWAYHCHLMLHMESGMFREVIVDEEAGHG